MRRLVVTAAALTVLGSGGIAQATTEPLDSSPSTDAAGTDAGTTVDDAPAVVYDDSGEAIATISVTSTVAGWTDYAEGDEPDEGNEYLQLTVDVESTVTEGSFSVATGDFILQDQWGFTTSAETVASAAQSEADEEIVGDAELANGESIELALTFQVGADVGGQSVFYRPEDDRLIDVAEVG